MNLQLFITQLTHAIQSVNSETTQLLHNICELLQSHLYCAVKVADSANNVIAEVLLLDKAPDGQAIHASQPIIAGDTTIATIQISRFGDSFSKDENLAFGVAISICTILLRQRESQLAADTKRRREAVRNLINSLTFSELETAVQMVKELDGAKLEGLLVAGNIADRMGFTRSVVTSALKKLEGASLIETRSLGMKGTFVRVKDALLIEELGKL